MYSSFDIDHILYSQHIEHYSLFGIIFIRSRMLNTLRIEYFSLWWETVDNCALFRTTGNMECFTCDRDDDRLLYYLMRFVSDRRNSYVNAMDALNTSLTTALFFCVCVLGISSVVFISVLLFPNNLNLIKRITIPHVFSVLYKYIMESYSFFMNVLEYIDFDQSWSFRGKNLERITPILVINMTKRDETWFLTSRTSMKSIYWHYSR